MIIDMKSKTNYKSTYKKHHVGSDEDKEDAIELKTNSSFSKENCCDPINVINLNINVNVYELIKDPYPECFNTDQPTYGNST